MKGKTCPCGGHGMCCQMGGRHHMLARIIIGVLVLLVVFWVGVKVGEVRSELFSRDFREGGMMRGGYRYESPIQAVPVSNGSAPSAAPVTGATSSAK